MIYVFLLNSPANIHFRLEVWSENIEIESWNLKKKIRDECIDKQLIRESDDVSTNVSINLKKIMSFNSFCKSVFGEIQDYASAAPSILCARSALYLFPGFLNRKFISRQRFEDMYDIKTKSCTILKSTV